jgi:hypothetical protein
MPWLLAQPVPTRGSHGRDDRSGAAMLSGLKDAAAKETEMSSSSTIVSPPLTRDESATLFSQTITLRSCR